MCSRRPTSRYRGELGFTRQGASGAAASGAAASGAAKDSPDGLAVALDGRPAPHVAERADDLQPTAVLPGPAGRPRRWRLVAGIGDREHDLADPAKQAQPQR